jgi:hypothetical protein
MNKILSQHAYALQGSSQGPSYLAGEDKEARPEVALRRT